MKYDQWDNRAITQISQQSFNQGLGDAVPDIVEGIWTDALPRSLHDHSLHSDAGNSLTFCHFTTEFVRSDGNFKQAESQATYCGAVLVNVRGRSLAQARANTR